MKWFMKLTLAKKLLATFISLALLTAGLGGYGLMNIVKVGGLMTDMYRNNLVAIDHLSNSYAAYLVYTRAVTRAPRPMMASLPPSHTSGMWSSLTPPGGCTPNIT